MSNNACPKIALTWKSFESLPRCFCLPNKLHVANNLTFCQNNLDSLSGVRNVVIGAEMPFAIGKWLKISFLSRCYSPFLSGDVMPKIAWVMFLFILLSLSLCILFRQKSYVAGKTHFRASIYLTNELTQEQEGEDINKREVKLCQQSTMKNGKLLRFFRFRRRQLFVLVLLRIWQKQKSSINFEQINFPLLRALSAAISLLMSLLCRVVVST